MSDSNEGRRLDALAAADRQELADLVDERWPESNQRERWVRLSTLIGKAGFALAVLALLVGLLWAWLTIENVRRLGFNQDASDFASAAFARVSGLWIAILALCIYSIVIIRATQRRALHATLRRQTGLGYPISRPGDLGVSTDVEGVREDVPNGSNDASAEFTRLWAHHERRLDAYHDAASDQAARSFAYGLIAATVGVVLVVAATIFAATAKTTGGAVAAGLAGMAGGGLGGYIGATFIRIQQGSAERLQVYFTQPAEMLRFLAAERVADSLPRDDPAWVEARRDLITGLIHGVGQADPASEQPGPGGAPVSVQA